MDELSRILRRIFRPVIRAAASGLIHCTKVSVDCELGHERYGSPSLSVSSLLSTEIICAGISTRTIPPHRRERTRLGQHERASSPADSALAAGRCVHARAFNLANRAL